MNKGKAGVKRRGSQGGKACHVPFAACGSFCVIGWLFFRLHQSQAPLCRTLVVKLNAKILPQPMGKKKVQEPILLRRFVSLANRKRCFMRRGVSQPPMGGRG